MDIFIRPETQHDREIVRAILISAFRTDAESRLVDMLRANGKAVLSLVAEHNGQVVGHIMFSPVTTSPPSQARGMGLAPLAVAPADQRQGVGSALIREGLQRCQSDYVVVLGDPKYYSRFGFEKASQFGLQNEYGADEAFRVLELTPGSLQETKGLVKYAPEFGQLDL